MRRLLVISSLIPILSCGSLSGPEQRREIGTVFPEGPGNVLTVPATASAGEPFTVTITTAGSSSCHVRSETEVEIEGDTAVITPYDTFELGNCTADLEAFDHEVSVTFDDAGAATVIARVRQGSPAEMTELVRTVEVR